MPDIGACLNAILAEQELVVPSGYCACESDDEPTVLGRFVRGIDSPYDLVHAVHIFTPNLSQVVERWLCYTSHVTLDVVRDTLYTMRVVRSFADKDTERLFGRQRVKRFVNIERAALRKLALLDAATELRDLASPPGNHLEALKNDRKGQHSIKINDQYRVCFKWVDGNAEAVEIVDYH